MTEITFQALAPGNAQPASEFMSTGPSGLLLGRGQSGSPLTLRLFRSQPTRLYLAVPDYITWLVAFRAMCVGAHLSVIAADHREWLTLADTIRACGGTIDLLRNADNLPGQGRPFRPSLIIDQSGAVPSTARLGAWQALAVIGDPSSSKAISELRTCDAAMVSPVEGKTAEHLRRAYALSSAQSKIAADLGESDVILAGVRRIARVSMPPSPTEYRLLFGN